MKRKTINIQKVNTIILCLKIDKLIRELSENLIHNYDKYK